MKRTLLDHEKNEDQNYSQDEYRFYLEHSIKTKNCYCLHFNFKSENAAKEMFDYLKDTCQLPVEIHENRIAISPRKNLAKTGVSSVVSRQAIFNGNEMMTICFLEREHSEYFHKFITENMRNSLLCVVLRHSMLEVGSSKDILLHPKFSLEKRVTVNSAYKENFSWYCALCFLFKNELPQEIIPIELLLFITELKIISDMPKIQLKLNQEFSLAKQNVEILPFKKTPCQISIEYDEEGVYNPRIFMACENTEVAKLLFDQIIKYVNLDIQLFDNEIAINPCFYSKATSASNFVPFGAIFNHELHRVYVNFTNENEANLFFMLIDPTNLDIQPELDRNKLRFEVNILPIHIPQAVPTQIVSNEEEDMVISSPLYKGFNG